ncbi:MAG TPA: Spy/CpxP family protein refolding chaperone [Syntrophorhabdaceae bacterium]|nr:Spy/CpxP family protein refolding chaperone [Syntrophorhabdaceae bacterium]
MKKGIIVAMALIFLAVATTTIYAAGPGNGPMGRDGSAPPRGGGMDRGQAGPMAGLNLSKDQMSKMWQLREKYRNETQAIRYELFQKSLDLKALYADPKATDAAILAKQKEVSALRHQIEDRMVQLRLDLRKILTPEQLQKLSEREPFRNGRFMREDGPEPRP